MTTSMDSLVERLSKALVGLTCGGSEFFTRNGDIFSVDVETCIAYVRRGREADQRRIIALIGENKDLIAHIAALEARVKELEEAALKALALLEADYGPLDCESATILGLKAALASKGDDK